MMQAKFVTSAPSWTLLPNLNIPELAIVGRSNVGKSSLLAKLLGHDKLVRTSRTPGRTQLLNLFVQGERMAWLDLPGYGFAKLSKTQRAHMATMTRAYLAQRPQLRGVLLVVDARRDGVSHLDVAMADWIMRHRRPLLVVATKADLVPRTRRQQQLRRIEASLGAQPGDAMALSSRTGEGMQALLLRIGQLEDASEALG